MKPYRRIFAASVLLTILLYVVDIYILDPIAPDPSWRYRIINFGSCLVLYSAGLFAFFSFIYIAIKSAKELITTRSNKR